MGRQSLTTFHMTRRIIRLWFSPIRWKSKTGLSFGLISRLRLMDSAQHGYLACCHRCIGLTRIVLAYIWQVHTLIFFDCHCGWSFEVPLTSTLHTSLNWSFEIFGSSWNVLGALEACCCRPQPNTALLREDRVKFLRTWSMVTPLAPEFGFAWVLVSGVTIARHTDSWNLADWAIIDGEIWLGSQRLWSDLWWWQTCIQCPRCHSLIRSSVLWPRIQVNEGILYVQ